MLRFALRFGNTCCFTVGWLLVLWNAWEFVFLLLFGLLLCIYWLLNLIVCRLWVLRCYSDLVCRLFGYWILALLIWVELYLFECVFDCYAFAVCLFRWLYCNRWHVLVCVLVVVCIVCWLITIVGRLTCVVKLLLVVFLWIGFV